MSEFVFNLPPEISESAQHWQNLEAAAAYVRRQYDLAVERLIAEKLDDAGIKIGDLVTHVNVPSLGFVKVYRAELELAWAENTKYQVALTCKDRNGKKYYFSLANAQKKTDA